MTYDLFSIVAWSMMNSKQFPRCKFCKVLYANYDKEICTECLHDDHHREEMVKLNKGSKNG